VTRRTPTGGEETQVPERPHRRRMRMFRGRPRRLLNKGAPPGAAVVA
jgi:hypothetical protein